VLPAIAFPIVHSHTYSLSPIAYCLVLVSSCILEEAQRMGQAI